MVSLKHETNKSQQESQRGAAWYKLSSCMWHPHKIYVVLSEKFGCPSTEILASRMRILALLHVINGRLEDNNVSMGGLRGTLRGL